MRFAILALVLILAGCASGKQKEGQLPNPPQRLKVSGISFLPPAEDDWWIGSKTAERLVVGRVGRLEGDTEAIEAGTIPVEPAATRLDRNRMMKALRERGLQPPRFRIRTHDLSEGQVDNIACAISYMLLEDREPEGGRTLNPVLIESLSMLCPHPMNPRIGSWLTYTHRSFPEDQDRVFKQRAGAVLETFEFEDL